jgi:hypothetical protein
VATVSQNASTGLNNSVVTSLKTQLSQGGADAQTFSIGLLPALSATSNNVIDQSTKADATSTVTGNPPPQEVQPIPVSPLSDADAAKAEAFQRIQENMSKPKVDVPLDQMIADVKAAQDANDAANGIVKDPATIAQEETIAAQLAAIDANRSNPQETPAPIEGPVPIFKQDQINKQIVLPNDNPTGPSYDDEGNLMPGWSLDEENNPVWIGNNKDGTVFVEPAVQASAAASRASVQGLKAKAQSQATQRNASDFAKAGDWRVRLSLAPGADYLYKSPNATELGILKPLAATDGIIFPYTPSISVAYNASYDNTELTHSNYRMYQYKSSSVDNITISCDFTAQDTQEANYLLATIHFLRTITKMFYGQDKGPAPGTPPPLVYLTGLGAFQFDRHPLAITNFNYTLPNEVDYIRAGVPASPPGVAKNTPGETNKPSLFSQVTSVASRLFGSNLLAGAQAAPPAWKTTQTGTVTEPTYVPTKMQIQITAVPIVSRGDISNRFSLTKYGTGDLLRGSKNNAGGIW